MFNDTPSQNKIGYCVSNKWYVHKKLESNMYIFLKFTISLMDFVLNTFY